MIYTMNCTDEFARQHNYPMHWNDIELYIANPFRYPVARICATTSTNLIAMNIT